ncbi:sensor histidine kinase [Sphingosinicella sp. BN140058]|uniref:sensor histidine kinase n=1 Tax=Sphingosinicella sp. BN140058 TaxID=1892855 RepID=UPI0010116B82|nr:ATP-binding protein [Sphingosinicella sp. BN140058]QAY77592.1 hypothetical protein ETR14_14545 [Sphingosinicella sp. BN140058]
MSGPLSHFTLVLTLAAAWTGAWLALDIQEEARTAIGRARRTLLLAAAAALAATAIATQLAAALGFPGGVGSSALWGGALLALLGAAAAMAVRPRRGLCRRAIATGLLTAGICAMAWSSLWPGSAGMVAALPAFLLSLASATAAAWTFLWLGIARRPLAMRACGAIAVGTALAAADAVALRAFAAHAPGMSPPSAFTGHAPALAAAALLLLFGALLAARAVRSEEERRITTLRGDLDRAGRLAGMNAVAATLAHELNQPLTAARNYAFVLKRKLGEGDHEEWLDRIDEQLGRCGDIIKKARVLAGAGKLERKPIDVRTSLDRCLALLRVDAALKPPEMRIGFAVGERVVMADPTQFEQVLVNILRNGWQALERTGGARMTIKSPPPHNGAVTLIISDNGPGLPAKSWNDPVAGLFTGKQGMGLGLGIARTIVEGHGGKLWAESNLLRGATFYIRLPAGEPGRR